jgi:hypothetical protein
MLTKLNFFSYFDLLFIIERDEQQEKTEEAAEEKRD